MKLLNRNVKTLPAAQNHNNPQHLSSRRDFPLKGRRGGNREGEADEKEIGGDGGEARPPGASCQRVLSEQTGKRSHKKQDEVKKDHTSQDSAERF